jgi:hypothetical protein
MSLRGVEKVFFNRKAHQVIAKHAELKLCISAICALCVMPWHPLRLMDFDFFNTPSQVAAKALCLLTHQVSNLDSSEPKSDVLPITPWVNFYADSVQK